MTGTGTRQGREPVPCLRTRVAELDWEDIVAQFKVKLVDEVVGRLTSQTGPDLADHEINGDARMRAELIDCRVNPPPRVVKSHAAATVPSRAVSATDRQMEAPDDRVVKPETQSSVSHGEVVHVPTNVGLESGREHNNGGSTVQALSINQTTLGPGIRESP